MFDLHTSLSALDTLPMPAIYTVVLSIALSLLVVGMFEYARGWRHDLPPGPPGWPIVGNALQVPTNHIATYFRNQLQIYGDLVSLKLFNTTFILIGDAAIATELLERRSANYSARPTTPYFDEHVDPDEHYWAFSGGRKSEANLIGRKLMTGLMNEVRAGGLDSTQELEAMWTTLRLLKSGGSDWYHEMNRVTSSTLNAAAFGKHFPTGHEPDSAEITRIADETVQLYNPGNLANFIPILGYVYPWKMKAKDFRDREAALYRRLVEEALVRSNTDGRTLWAATFANSEKYGDQRHLINQLGQAAVETTAATLHAFFLACVMYPERIEAAQRQIDQVVGSSRVPSFKDRANLPYVDAIYRELLRWRPATRYAVPHMSTADEVVEYRGKTYFIPKDSVVIGVPWQLEHDATRYKEPGEFRPDRFLDNAGRLEADYKTTTFGFGRRVCPGALFAENVLWINIAVTLWMFHIRKSSDVNSKTGRPFEYSDSDEMFTPGLTTGPVEFPVVLVPRDDERVEALRRTWEVVQDDFVE